MLVPRKRQDRECYHGRRRCNRVPANREIPHPNADQPEQTQGEHEQPPPNWRLVPFGVRGDCHLCPSFPPYPRRPFVKTTSRNVAANPPIAKTSTNRMLPLHRSLKTRAH